MTIDPINTDRAEHVAPLCEALGAALRALNTARCFRVGETDSYKIAALCEAALRAAGRKA